MQEDPLSAIEKKYSSDLRLIIIPIFYNKYHSVGLGHAKR